MNTANNFLLKKLYYAYKILKQANSKSKKP